MVSWGAIQSLAIFFGPWLIPRILGWYRSVRNKPASQIRPLPQKTSYALAILFVSGVLAFLSTLPVFAPENIFWITQSRLHTSAGVLLTRLAAIRPVTAQDERLRALFDAGGLEARLLYARYGPSVVMNNPLSKPGDIDAGRNFLIYALPSILTPHIMHLLTLGISTSSLLSGREGASWRTLAITSGLILSIVELYFISNYSDVPNARSMRATDIDFIHWKLQVYRGLAISVVDGILGWVIWLQATGRAFINAKPASERIMDTTMNLEKLFAKVRGVGVVRNGAVRDAGVRRRVEDYWVKEGEVMKDVFEEPEILEAQRNALRRLDPTRVGRDADSFIDSILVPQLGSAAAAANASIY